MCALFLVCVCTNFQYGKQHNKIHESTAFFRVFPAIYLFSVIQFYSCDAICSFIVVSLSHVLNRLTLTLLHLIIPRFRTRIRTESNNCIYNKRSNSNDTTRSAMHHVLFPIMSAKCIHTAYDFTFCMLKLESFPW